MDFVSEEREMRTNDRKYRPSAAFRYAKKFTTEKEKKKIGLCTT